MRILEGLELRVRRLRRMASPLLWAGDAVHCPICERSFRGFRRAGKRRTRRANAICPYCTARERDRLAFLFLRGSEQPPAGSPLLHVAPEACLEAPLRDLAGDGYVSADLIRADVDQRFDVMAIPHADASFFGVFCSHVLQDVRDDVRAMSEFFRILKPGGWAVLNVPVTAEETVDHQDRPRHTRARLDRRPPEHLRTYGNDFEHRMASVGFEVRVIRPDDLADPHEQSRLGIAGEASGSVFFGLKPGDSVRGRGHAPNIGSNSFPSTC